MCDLCDDDIVVRERAVGRELRAAELLYKLAAWHQGLATGRFKPHEERGMVSQFERLLIVKEIVDGLC